MRESKPSISTRSWLSVCSFSSWPPIGADAAGAPERVELVDEDDGRRLGTRLLEQVAHARSADADEHLHEFGAGDGEERHFGLPGDGLGEQRLAGSGRPDQEHALRHPPAEAAVLLRVFQKIDDLPQLVLGLVDPGDIVEAHAGIGFDVNLRLAFADRHQAAAEALASGATEDPQPKKARPE